MGSKTWLTMYRIPGYLVQGFGDSGTSETVFDDGAEEKDDLRVHLELSGGVKVLLSGQLRIIINADGDVFIEKLVRNQE